jgi:hypothetical protein
MIPASIRYRSPFAERLKNGFSRGDWHPFEPLMAALTASLRHRHRKNEALGYRLQVEGVMNSDCERLRPIETAVSQLLTQSRPAHADESGVAA